MNIIEKVHIAEFRGFHDVDINFGMPVNAIIGRNGTMKTTLLGILAHPFSLETGEMSKELPLTGGKKYNSLMSDKFKFSDRFDIPGEHKWTLSINKHVYPKGDYSCVSERRTDNNRIRFWSTEGRDKGMNYIQCPVIFLSMKRLLPIGEEKGLKVEKTSLTDDEIKIYRFQHNKILICNEIMTDVTNLESANKHTLGPITDHSDALTISAGQDNVGRIILAVFSMKRLMEKYRNEYKGGIIFIDEIESTLYPAAQEKLIEYLFEAAEKYRLQFFFTTHSMSTIRFLKTSDYYDRCKMVYLQKLDGKIKAWEDPELNEIENDLNVATGKKKNSNKIKVYCEDETARILIKSLLPGKIKSHVNFVEKMDLSWTIYKNLYEHKVPEFLNNIIVLDGDVRQKKTGWKGCPKNSNIVLLPTNMFPEKMIYEELFDLSQNDSFWDNSLGGYSKDVCFREYPNHIEDKTEIKQWFKSQKEYSGRAYSKFFNKWKHDHPKEVEEFVRDFVASYNRVSKTIGSSQINMEL